MVSEKNISPANILFFFIRIYIGYFAHEDNKFLIKKLQNDAVFDRLFAL